MIRIAKAAGAVGTGVLSLGISAPQACLLEAYVHAPGTGLDRNVLRIQ